MARRIVLTRNGTLFLLALAICLPLTGCYTRLTSAKEAREYRATYPELDQNIPISLRNAQDNMGNSFIMTAEAYVEGVRRFNRGIGATDVSSFIYRPGSYISIKLTNYKDNGIDGIYQVKPEGTIDLPYNVVNFVVANRTSDQVRKDLQERFKTMFRGTPNADDPLPFTVNLATPQDAVFAGTSQFGSATLLSLAVGTTNSALRENNAGGGSSISSSGTDIPLRGDDNLTKILARSGAYNGFVDWREIVVMRKIRTQRIHEESGRPIEYWLLIVCDLEQTLYENPNLNIDIRDGDQVVLHAEKTPAIVELFRTAQVIFDIYSSFQGLEFVLEDLFKRDF